MSKKNFDRALEDLYLSFSSTIPPELMNKFPEAFIFTQELKCYEESNGGKKPNRKNINKLEMETTRLVQNYTEALLSHCGDQCLSSEGRNKKANSGEYTSDWIASRALLKHINRIPLDKRLDFVNQTMTLFCPPLLPDKLSEIARQVIGGLYLLIFTDYIESDNHPESEERREGIFFPAMQESLGCTSSKSNFMSCEGM